MDCFGCYFAISVVEDQDHAGSDHLDIVPYTHTHTQTMLAYPQRHLKGIGRQGDLGALD